MSTTTQPQMQKHFELKEDDSNVKSSSYAINYFLNGENAKAGKIKATDNIFVKMDETLCDFLEGIRNKENRKTDEKTITACMRDIREGLYHKVSEPFKVCFVDDGNGNVHPVLGDGHHRLSAFSRVLKQDGSIPDGFSIMLCAANWDEIEKHTDKGRKRSSRDMARMAGKDPMLITLGNAAVSILRTTTIKGTSLSEDEKKCFCATYERILKVASEVYDSDYKKFGIRKCEYAPAMAAILMTSRVNKFKDDDIRKATDIVFGAIAKKLGNKVKRQTGVRVNVHYEKGFMKVFGDSISAHQNGGYRFNEDVGLSAIALIENTLVKRYSGTNGTPHAIRQNDNMTNTVKADDEIVRRYTFSTVF